MASEAKNLAVTVALTAVGGLVGGLFTAGAWSSTGAAIAVAGGGFLQRPAVGKGGSGKPNSPEGANYEAAIPEFVGTVGNVQGQVITVAKNGQDQPAGVLVVTRKQKNGKGGSKTEVEDYYLVAEFLLGRSAGGSLVSPDPLFVDVVEVEDSNGRRAIYNRNGESAEARGYALVQTISSVTGRVICETSTVLRLYTGTDEQMPDSAMQEYWGEDLPAHRGCAKVVFNRLPLSGGAATFYFTVRSATTGRRTLVQQRLEAAGIPAERIVLDALPAAEDELGTIAGKLISGQTCREICEKSARTAWCDFAFDGARIVATSRRNPVIHSVAWSSIGAWAVQANAEAESDGDGRLVLQFKGHEDLPSAARVAFVDSNQNYEANSALAQQPRATWTNAVEYDLAEVGTLGRAMAMARALRDESWLQDSEVTFSVLPGHDDWMVGDVVELPLSAPVDEEQLGTRQFLILQLEVQDTGILAVTGTPWAAHVYEQDDTLVGPVQPKPSVLVTAAPLFGAVDCVALTDFSPDQVSSPGILLWASQSRRYLYNGVLLRVGTADNDDRYQERTFYERAICGTLTADFSPATDSTVSLRTQYGELASCTEELFQVGANLIVLETGLMVRFRTATIDSYDPDLDEVHYTLSGIEAGEYGSDYAAAGWGETVPAGTKWVQLVDADNDAAPGLRYFPMPPSAIGTTVVASAMALSEAQPKTTRTFTYQGRNAQPLSPTIVEASLDGSAGLRLAGRSRTRYAADNYQWDTSRHRISEPQFGGQFKYQMVMTDGVTTRRVDLFTADAKGDFDFEISAGELAGWFGGPPANLTVNLAQYGHYGVGRLASIALEAS